MCLHRLSADQKLANSWKKKRFGAYHITSIKLLLVTRHTLITGLKKTKVGSVNFADSPSPPSILRNVCTGSKSGQGT